MALTLVQESQATGSGTDVTATLAAGPTANNLMVCLVTSRNTAHTITMSASENWTQIGSQFTGTGENLNASVFYKIAGGSEPQTAKSNSSVASTNRICHVAEFTYDFTLDTQSLDIQDGGTTESINYTYSNDPATEGALIFFNCVGNWFEALTHSPGEGNFISHDGITSSIGTWWGWHDLGVATASVQHDVSWTGVEGAIGGGIPLLQSPAGQGGSSFARGRIRGWN